MDTVAPGSAAAIAGLRKGDRIVSVDDRPVANTMDLYQELVGQAAEGHACLRAGGEPRSAFRSCSCTTRREAPTSGSALPYHTYHSPRVGFGGAVRQERRGDMEHRCPDREGIGLLFQGIKLRNAVAGPLRITYYIGTAATSGFQLGVGVGLVSFFRFLAFLSVVLFLMNLLPIPAMDGGQIILFIVEIVRGKPVRSRLIWRMQIIGFSLLIMLSLCSSHSAISCSSWDGRDMKSITRHIACFCESTFDAQVPGVRGPGGGPRGRGAHPRRRLHGGELPGLREAAHAGVSLPAYRGEGSRRDVPGSRGAPDRVPA